MQCSKCKRIIIKYPCPHCGHEGDVFIGKESGTGGGRP